MSMHDKIKEAFKKNRPLKSSWSQEYQPNIHALDIFLRKSGYRLVDIIKQSKEDNTIPELVIEPVKEGYLYPEITHSPEEGIFYIEVKKYGQLTAEDVEGVIKGYQNALGVVRHLEEVDMAKINKEAKEI